MREPLPFDRVKKLASGVPIGSIRPSDSDAKFGPLRAIIKPIEREFGITFSVGGIGGKTEAYEPHPVNSLQFNHAAGDEAVRAFRELIEEKLARSGMPLR